MFLCPGLGMKRPIVLLACLLAACSSNETTLVLGEEETVDLVEDESGEYPPGPGGEIDGASMCDLYGEGSVTIEVDGATLTVDVPVLCNEHYIETGRPPEVEEVNPAEMMSTPEGEAASYE